jgi:hypothetical protein
MRGRRESAKDFGTFLHTPADFLDCLRSGITFSVMPKMGYVKTMDDKDWIPISLA